MSSATTTLYNAVQTLSLDALRKALADDSASANKPHEGLTPLAYLATKKPSIEDYEKLKNIGLANRDTTEQVVRNRTLHIYETMAKFIATTPGADLNSAGSDGRTALHRAAQEANEDLVNVLIDGGADLNIQDDQGRTPVMVAETFTIRRILTYAGADLKIQDTAGNTVLHLLLQKDPADPSSTALVSKADPTLLLVKNKEGMTPDKLAEQKANHINERFAHYQENELTRKKADWEESFQEDGASAIYEKMNEGCVVPSKVQEPKPSNQLSLWRRFWNFCCFCRRRLPRESSTGHQLLLIEDKTPNNTLHVSPQTQTAMKISKDMLLKGTKFILSPSERTNKAGCSTTAEFVEGEPEESIQKRERKPIVIDEFKYFSNEIAAAHVPAELDRFDFSTKPLHRQSNFTASEEQEVTPLQEMFHRQQKELDEVFQILHQTRSLSPTLEAAMDAPPQPLQPLEEIQPSLAQEEQQSAAI
jgi:hypothetical protein